MSGFCRIDTALYLKYKQGEGNLPKMAFLISLDLDRFRGIKKTQLDYSNITGLSRKVIRSLMGEYGNSVKSWGATTGPTEGHSATKGAPVSKGDSPASRPNQGHYTARTRPPLLTEPKEEEERFDPPTVERDEEQDASLPTFKQLRDAYPSRLFGKFVPIKASLYAEMGKPEGNLLATRFTIKQVADWHCWCFCTTDLKNAPGLRMDAWRKRAWGWIDQGNKRDDVKKAEQWVKRRRAVEGLERFNREQEAEVAEEGLPDLDINMGTF